MSYREPYSDVVIKLGLTKGTKSEFSLFRRVSPLQLFSQGKNGVSVLREDGVSVLKTHSVQLYLSCFEEPVNFSLDDYAVTLTYGDSDGDTVLIHSKEDLVEAMHERRSSRKKHFENLKILATVQEKKTTKADMRVPTDDTSQVTMSAADTMRPIRLVSPVPSTRVEDSASTGTAASASHSKAPRALVPAADADGRGDQEGYDD